MRWPRNALTIGRKLDCLNPNVQWWNFTLVGSPFVYPTPWGATDKTFVPWYALPQGRCPARACKDMSGAPTSFSTRSSVTEHGMPYEARALRARSANSTRGRHASPGGTGEPCTGGSGTGGWRARSCEVREMRYAAAAQALVRVLLEKGHWRADGYGNGHDQFGGGCDALS